MLGGQLTSGIWRCIREPGLLVCQQEQISEGSLGEEGEEARGRAEGLEVEVGGGAEAGREPGDIPGGGPEKRAYMLGSGVPNALRWR